MKKEQAIAVSAKKYLTNQYIGHHEKGKHENTFNRMDWWSL